MHDFYFITVSQPLGLMKNEHKISHLISNPRKTTWGHEYGRENYEDFGKSRQKAVSLVAKLEYSKYGLQCASCPVCSTVKVSCRHINVYSRGVTVHRGQFCSYLSLGVRVRGWV